MKKIILPLAVLLLILALLSCGENGQKTEKKTYAGDGWSAVYKP